MADIANNIKSLRQQRQMTQTQLAEKIGVTRQTVSGWERGTSCPGIDMLEKLSSIFGVGMDELLYPQRPRRKKLSPSKPLTAKFLVISVLMYCVLLIWGGGLIAIPLFHKLLGGGIGEEFIFILYWGLILLVAYIGLCTCLLSEYFCNEKEASQVNDD